MDSDIEPTYTTCAHARISVVAVFVPKLSCISHSSVAEKKRRKEEEAGITDGTTPQTLSQDSGGTVEAETQHHRDSASTLNRGSSNGDESVVHSYELQPAGVTPSTAVLSLTDTEPGPASNSDEGNSQQVCVCLFV